MCPPPPTSRPAMRCGTADTCRGKPRNVSGSLPVRAATIRGVESSTQTPTYYPPGYQPEPAARPPFWKRAGGAIAAAGLILAKFAAKAKALLFLLPKVKLLTTSASMLVSIAAYALFWGWSFGVGFVLLLLVH